MKRSFAVAAVLIIVIGSAVLIEDPSPTSAVQPARRLGAKSAPPTEAGLIDRQPGMAARRQTPIESGPIEDEAGGDDAEPADKEPQRVGTIEGIVYDHKGYPAPNRAVRFVQGSSSVKGRSNEVGSFRIDSVPVGRWESFFVNQHPSVLKPALTAYGEITISEGQISWMEFRLLGERSLTGQFLFDLETWESPVFPLRFELFLREDPQARIASSKTTISRVPPWEGGRRQQPEHQAATEQGDVEPPWMQGAIYFENLPPEHYILRIIPDTNERVTVTIHDFDVEVELYTEREVDLTTQDVVLPQEVLSFDEDFLVPALQRL